MEKKVWKKPTLVLMAGLPGVGKSTLAKELGAALGWSVLDRDDFKDAILEDELLNQNISEEDSGRAAYEGLFKIAESFLVEQHMSLILDSSTLYQFIVDRAMAITKSSGAQLKVVYCKVDEPTRQHRLRTRKKRLSQRNSQLIAKSADIRFKYLPANKIEVDTKRPLKSYKTKVLAYINEQERNEPEPPQSGSTLPVHKGKHLVLSGTSSTDKLRNWFSFIKKSDVFSFSLSFIP